MIPIAMRLLWRGGWESRARVGLVAGGVSIGVGLLLLVLGAMSALSARDTRSAWMNVDQHSTSKLATLVRPGETKPGNVLWLRHDDTYDGSPLYRFDIATLGDVTWRVLGMPNPPKDDEFYASPALDRAMQQAPANQLRDRFKGTRVGSIDERFLPYPNALVAIEGRGVQELERGPGTMVLSGFPSQPPPYTGLIKIMLVIGALGLLAPIVVLMSTATRLSAAERLQRFATLRLIGSTPGQVGKLMAIESALTATVGAVVGWVLYDICYPFAAQISVGGSFFPHDFVLNGMLVAAILLGIIGLAMGAALISVRGVWHSTLESRTAKTARTVSVWRMIPLILGLGILQLLIMTRPINDSTYLENANVQLGAPLGFILVLWGTILAGPLLVKWLGVLMGRSPGSAAGLIASRHLRAAPRIVFRNLSGIVVVVFVVSVFIGASEGIVQALAGQNASTLPSDMIILRSASPIEDNSQIDGLDHQLRSTAGVKDVAVVYTMFPQGGGEAVSYIKCKQRHLVGLADCAGRLNNTLAQKISGDSFRVSGPVITVGEGLPAMTFLVRTDNDHATIDRLRTITGTVLPLGSSTLTVTENSNPAAPVIARLRHFAYAGMAISVVIATLSLLVAAAGSVLERRRPFALLRLTGMPLGQLSWSLALETAMPLLCALVFASGTGYIVANMLLRIGKTQLVAPSLAYYMFILGCFVLSLLILSIVLPFTRMTTKEVRFE